MADESAEQGDCRYPCIRPDILGGSTFGNVVRVRDVGNEPPHWEGVGRIPSQGCLQDDGAATSSI